MTGTPFFHVEVRTEPPLVKCYMVAAESVAKMPGIERRILIGSISAAACDRSKEMFQRWLALMCSAIELIVRESTGDIVHLDPATAIDPRVRPS